MSLRIPGLLVALSLFAGCAGSVSPAQSARELAGALRAGDAEAAYALLSSEFRSRVSLEDFRRELRLRPEEHREAAALYADLAEAERTEAQVTLSNGETVVLHLEDGQWRLAGARLNFYDQSTPRQALRSFVRALRQRRFDIALRFVPEAELEGLTAESLAEAWTGPQADNLERMLLALERNLEQPIEVSRDTAAMEYGSGQSVVFVREGALWKILRPE